MYKNGNKYDKFYRNGILYQKGMMNGKQILGSGIQVRYIRDWINGSTSNTSIHWVEIMALDSQGNNVALNKQAQGADGSDAAKVTDGDTNTDNYYEYFRPIDQPGNVTIDLGANYSLKSLKVWHYYYDGRSYHETKTEVSTDGINWTTVFNSAVSGEYPETPAGHEIIL